VDPHDVVVPEGYRVEVILAGLSFPTAIEFAPDGTVFVAEGGSTWPTRPYMPARLLSLDPSGNLEVIAIEGLGGPRGLAWRDGELYVSVKGGYFMRIVKYDPKTRRRSVVVDGVPSGGWHEPGGPVFGPDGLMYFGQGSISLNGVVEPGGFTVDLAKHPEAHDVPGQDVTLTGNNVWMRNPTSVYPYLAETGAFKPFGVPATKGEVVKGETLCSTSVMRAQPDGSGLELLAWGVRNPWGMAFDEAGDLYVCDLCMEEKGDRAVAEDPGKVWRIKNARLPHGNVTTPDWYGFPEICGDGLPVWHEKHHPNRGQAPRPLIENPPPWAGPAAYLVEPHAALGKLDFCRSDAFGCRGQMFLCLFGTYYPLNSTRPEHQDRGFSIRRVDLGTGRAEAFLHNRHAGPATLHGSGGIERPVDCKFHPDGRSLYVLDFGRHVASHSHVVAYARTGVLWRVSRE
jgi:glucose/arabinose dehydrogenase